MSTLDSHAHHAHRRRSAILLSFLGLAPASLLAQTSSCPDVQIGTGNFVCLPSVTSGAYAEMATGDIDGDLSLDLAVVRGTSLVLFSAPAIQDAGIVQSEDAVDVCFCPGTPTTQKPSFYYTTSEGLRRIHLTGPGALHDDFMVGTSAFAGARIAYDHFGKQLVGVKSDLRTFVTASLAVESVGTPTTLFTLAQDVLDFEPMNWDGGVPAVGILRPNGAQVRRLNGTGTVIVGRTTAVAGDEAITVVRKNGQTDALAWLTDVGIPTEPTEEEPLGHPQQSIVLFTNATAGLLYQAPVPLGEVAWNDLDASDLHDDGREDLTLAPVEGWNLQTLKNLATTGWNSPDVNPELPATNPAFALELEEDEGVFTYVGYEVPMLEGIFVLPSTFTGVTQLLCADFFNDREGALRQPGFAVVMQGLDGVRFNPHIDAPQVRTSGPLQLPPPAAADFEGAGWLGAQVSEPMDEIVELCQTSNPSSPWTQAQGDWEIELGGGWGDTTGANQIELIVRLQLPNQHPQSVAWHHWLFDVCGNQVAGTKIRFSRERVGVDFPGPDIQVDPGGYYSDATRYWAIVRPVETNGSGQVLTAWRWSILSMSSDCTQYGNLLSVNGHGVPLGPIRELEDIPILGFCSVGGTESADSRSIPHPVPQTRIPGPQAWPVLFPPNY